MKTTGLRLAAFLAAVLLGGSMLLTSCKKDQKIPTDDTAGSYKLEKLSTMGKQVSVTAPDAVAQWIDPLSAMFNMVPEKEKFIAVLKEKIMPTVFDALKGVSVQLKEDGTAVFSGVQGVTEQPTGKWSKEGDSNVKLTVDPLKMSEDKMAIAKAKVFESFFKAGAELTLTRVEKNLEFSAHLSDVLKAAVNNLDLGSYGTLIQGGMTMVPPMVKVSVIMVKK